MPEQKGKRKTKRARRRLGTIRYYDDEQEPKRTAAPVKQTGRPPVRRRGWQAPLWLNLTIGIAMLAFGIFYFVTTSGHGMSNGTRIILLVGYCLVAGFYLVRAARQYMGQRGP